MSDTPLTDAAIAAANDANGAPEVCDLCGRLERLARELRDALTAISTNPHLDLQDKIYDVRDREGEGWNGPLVTAWNNACRLVDAALTKAKDYLP